MEQNLYAVVNLKTKQLLGLTNKLNKKTALEVQTTDRHEPSRGLSATAELLVVGLAICFSQIIIGSTNCFRFQSPQISYAII